MIQLGSIASVGWFIFSAPQTIHDNLSIWQEQFNIVAEIAHKVRSQISIDVHDAAALALKAVEADSGWDPANVEIVDIHSHWQNLNGVHAYNFDIAESSAPKEWPRFHQDAIRQYDARYFILLRRDTEAVSVVVRANGEVEASMKMHWR